MSIIARTRTVIESVIATSKVLRQSKKESERDFRTIGVRPIEVTLYHFGVIKLGAMELFGLSQIVVNERARYERVLLAASPAYYAIFGRTEGSEFLDLQSKCKTVITKIMEEHYKAAAYEVLGVPEVLRPTVGDTELFLDLTPESLN